jgi:hypothetical protein
LKYYCSCLVVGGDQQERAQQGGHGEAQKRDLQSSLEAKRTPKKEERKNTQTMSLQI